MMEAARTSETSVDNYFTRQYIPEDNSELKINTVRYPMSEILGSERVSDFGYFRIFEFLNCTPLYINIHKNKYEKKIVILYLMLLDCWSCYSKHGVWGGD
jgi:hypothetical protein